MLLQTEVEKYIKNIFNFITSVRIDIHTSKMSKELQLSKIYILLQQNTVEKIQLLSL
jgi:hypothetical protein